MTSNNTAIILCGANAQVLDATRGRKAGRNSSGYAKTLAEICSVKYSEKTARYGTRILTFADTVRKKLQKLIRYKRCSLDFGCPLVEASDGEGGSRGVHRQDDVSV